MCSEASNPAFASEFWSDILGQEKDAQTSLLENIVFHRDKHHIERLESLERGAPPP